MKDGFKIAGKIVLGMFIGAVTGEVASRMVDKAEKAVREKKKAKQEKSLN